LLQHYVEAHPRLHGFENPLLVFSMFIERFRSFCHHHPHGVPLIGVLIALVVILIVVVLVRSDRK
jgi:hypothetical protein